MPDSADVDSEFKAPPTTKVWRYLDLSKLIHVLDSGTLWFCRGDLLGDPFEGSVPLPHQRLTEIKERFAQGLGVRFLSPVDLQPLDLIAEAFKQQRRQRFINCWHMNEHESAAMWQVYLKSNEGVAIHSTIERLLRSRDDIFAVEAGEVLYVEYGKSLKEIRSGRGIDPCMLKRKSFEHERELRLMLRLPLKPEAEIPRGIAIKYHLVDLIQGIRVAPSCEDWFVSVVQATVDQFASKSGVRVKVEKSDLSKEPLF